MNPVTPRAKDYNRVARRIELALDQPPASTGGAIEMILHASADVLGITGSCWHHTDPSSGSSTARMRTEDGGWFLVNAWRLDSAGCGEVAVVMQPAPALAVLDGALRALGLSAREREVAALLLPGHSAKAIAAALTISPWTVQDHIKAIYEKTGVRSRPELVTLVPGAVAPA
jgi:DNA-binding CsgD family transcriptional regulator